MNYLDVYNNMPIVVQHLGVSIVGVRIRRIRYNRIFYKTLVQLEERRFRSRDEISHFQLNQLSKVIYNSYTNVPYYRRLFRQLSLKPEDIRDFDDFASLPVLSKDDLLKNRIEFVSSQADRKSLIRHHTSGTTGAGLTLYQERQMEPILWAHLWRYRRSHGIDFSNWCGSFGSKPVVPAKQSSAPFWRYCFPLRQTYFSIHHLSDETIPLYVREIKRRKIMWLHGYPSALSAIASYIIENGVNPELNLRWLSTGAENLTSQDSKKMHIAFGVYPIQHYGLEERNVHIVMCPKGKLHVDEDFSYVEFIPSDKFADCYRIIGTTFWNRVMPLIRYDTGDLALINSNETCNCTNLGRVVSRIVGRSSDYVVTKSGRKVIGMNQLFKMVTSIKSAQIRQLKPGLMRIDVVPTRGFSSDERKRIIDEVHKRIPEDEMDLSIQVTTSLHKVKSGKFQLVIREFD